MLLNIYGKKCTNIFTEHDLNILRFFWHKIKINNFDSHNVYLVIATNIKPGNTKLALLHRQSLEGRN